MSTIREAPFFGWCVPQKCVQHPQPTLHQLLFVSTFSSSAISSTKKSQAYHGHSHCILCMAIKPLTITKRWSEIKTCKSRRMGTSVSSILAARERHATDRSWSIQALPCCKTATHSKVKTPQTSTDAVGADKKLQRWKTACSPKCFSRKDCIAWASWAIIPAGDGVTWTDPCNLQKGQRSKDQNYDKLAPVIQHRALDNVRSWGSCTALSLGHHHRLTTSGCHDSHPKLSNLFFSPTISSVQTIVQIATQAAVTQSWTCAAVLLSLS